MFTNKQESILSMNIGYTEVMAKELWEANQKAEYEPTHPNWDSLKDPIKDDYRKAALIAVLANNGEQVDLDSCKYKDCINQLINLIESGYKPQNIDREDVINDAKKMSGW